MSPQGQGRTGDPAAALEKEALAALAEGRREEALAAAEQACERAPERAEALAVLGRVLLALGRTQEAVGYYERACELAPARAATHFDLGVARDYAGRLRAAARAFRAALEREPRHEAALAALADLLGRMKQTGQAVAVYEQLLAVRPDHPSARHLIAGLRGETTAAAPPTYVANLFDGFAGHFDEALGGLAYRVPEMTRLVLEACGVERFGFALDLGCGTGLVGAAVRDRVDRLHGVDLSAQMVEKARAKGIYDELVVGEIIEVLRGAAEPRYDLVLAGDVLCYLGDLTEAMAAVRGRMAPGGLFIFSVERLDEGEVRLGAKGRFAHGQGHVERTAAAAGFELLSCEAAPLRLEMGVPVEGWMCVLRARPSAG